MKEPKMVWAHSICVVSLARSATITTLALTAVAALLASPVGAAGAPTPVGPPSQITFDQPSEPLGRLAVARRSDGSFQVLWDAVGADDSGRGVLSLPVSLQGLPLATPQRLNEFEASNQRDVAITRAGDELVVAWSSETQGGAGAGAIVARRMDPWGAPSGDEVVIREAQCFPDHQFPGTFDCERLDRPRLAAAANGVFAAFWEGFFSDGHHLFRFYAEGASFDGDDAKLTDIPIGQRSLLDPDGAVISTDAETTTTYTEQIEGDEPTVWHAFLERRDATGELVGARQRLDTAADARSVALAADPDGNFLVVWTQSDTDRLLGRHFDATGAPLSGVLELIPDEGLVVSLAADGRGTYLLVSPTPVLGGYDLQGVRIGPEGLASTPFRINSTPAASPGAVVAAGDGEALVVWRDGEGSDEVLLARGFSTSICHSEAQTLCLGGGRFAVSVDWTDHQGHSGFGHAAPLTADSGTFWFFDPDNLELVVKILDGGSINDHYWTFYGALSNVGYRLEVADLVAARRRVYTNPPGVMASVGDTRSLPSAGEVADPGGSGALASTAALWARDPWLPASTGSGCAAGDASASLCLRDGRFRVEVTWQDFSGGSGAGQAIDLTSDTGAFWFFRPGNVELMVKILDGGVVNGRFWVFYGAVSNVAYELTVTDTVSGAQQRYVNPSGHFGSRADVDAFPSD